MYKNRVYVVQLACGWLEPSTPYNHYKSLCSKIQSLLTYLNYNSIQQQAQFEFQKIEKFLCSLSYNILRSSSYTSSQQLGWSWIIKEGFLICNTHDHGQNAIQLPSSPRSLVVVVARSLKRRNKDGSRGKQQASYTHGCTLMHICHRFFKLYLVFQKRSTKQLG